MDIQAVRQGLADRADTIAGLNVTAHVPDSVSEPHFFPAEVDVDYDKTYGRGMDELMVTCRVLVGRPGDESGLLAGYLKGSGATSLKAAIEGTVGVAQTLGGACHDLRVERVQGYRFYEHNGSKYVGAEIVVKVIGEGD
jgi:hypothetical protein